MRRELTTRKPELEATRIPTPIDIAWAAVNATHGLEFLCGMSPDGLSVEQLRAHILSYYDALGEAIKQAMPARSHGYYLKRKQSGYYEQKRKARSDAKVVAIA